jgi:hypothetical protein
VGFLNLVSLVRFQPGAPIRRSTKYSVASFKQSLDLFWTVRELSTKVATRILSPGANDVWPIR